MKNLIWLILLTLVAGGVWLWITDREKAMEITDQMKTKAKDVGAATTQAVEEAKPKLEQAKAAAADAADKAHRATTQAIENAQPYVDKIKSATTQAAETVRRKVTSTEPNPEK
jgi:sensor c-di-GMP phosphodiesterase-like protein